MFVARLRSVALLMSFVLLAGCGAATVTVTVTATPPPVPTATVTPPNLTTVDWANFTYPNTCTPSPATLTTHDGKAPLPNNDTFIVNTPIFGDVTGDGQPEAVIPNDCIGGQPRGKQFLVYTGTAAAPQFLTSLPLSSDPQPDIAIGDPTKVTFGGNQTLTIGGLGYSVPAIPICCPDLSITDTFTWQASHLVLTNQQRASFMPPSPTPTP